MQINWFSLVNVFFVRFLASVGVFATVPIAVIFFFVGFQVANAVCLRHIDLLQFHSEWFSFFSQPALSHTHTSFSITNWTFALSFFTSETLLFLVRLFFPSSFGFFISCTSSWFLLQLLWFSHNIQINKDYHFVSLFWESLCSVENS